MDASFVAIIKQDPIYPVIMKVLEARKRRETLSFADAIALVEVESGKQLGWSNRLEPVEIGRFNTSSRTEDDVRYATYRALMGGQDTRHHSQR